MGTVRKTITLTEQQNTWIAGQIDAGVYTTDSEAIRDLIRREQQRNAVVDMGQRHLVSGDQIVSSDRDDDDENRDDDDSEHDDDDDFGDQSDDRYDPDHIDNDPRPREDRDIPWSDIPR